MLYRRYPVARHDSNRFKKISSRNINGSLYYKLQQVQKKIIFRKKYLKKIGVPFWDLSAHYTETESPG